MKATRMNLVERNTMKKTVSFNELSNKVHQMVVWSFASRKARESKYERLAVDRSRFYKRIKDCELVLEKILNNEHRCKIFKDRFK